MTFEVDALRIWLANRHRLRDGLTLERFLMQFECFVAKMSVRNFLWWCSPRLSAFFWLKRNQCKCMRVDHVKTLVWYQKWLSCLRESAQLRTVYNQNILTFLMLGSLLNMASPASAEEKDDFITTLAKWTKAGSEDMKVYLKVVYAQNLKTNTKWGELHKVVGKLVDLGGTALYFESRGKTPEQCMKPVQSLTEGAVVLAKKLKIVPEHQYYADRFADFGEKGCRTSFQVVPQALQPHISLRSVFPVAKFRLKTLLPYGRNYQRVDVIGLVMSVEEPSLKTGPKHTCGWKMSRTTSSWSTFGASHWWRKRGRCGVLMWCRWTMWFCRRWQWLQTWFLCLVTHEPKWSPGGKVEATLYNWWGQQNLRTVTTKGASLRQETNKGEAIVTCCSTAAACSAGASALPLVEVALCGVWPLAVKGTEIAYLAGPKLKRPRPRNHV